ncbi:MAG: AI-2E family transporter, partial [Candidatus Dojkabacteria bacterium]|nr:AI-2E family transporter [Candidatus Dojkabacteria bacterium]
MAEDTTRTVTIQISPYTMIAVALFVLGLIFLYSVREVLFIIFFAFILTSTLREPVRKLTERRVPKVLAILAIYLGIFLSFTLVLTLVAVPLARETIRFFDNLPELLEKILTGLNRIGSELGLVSRNIDSDIVDENLGGWVDTIQSNLGNLVDIGRQGAAGAIE